MLAFADVLTHFAPAHRVGPNKYRTRCPVHGGGSLVITDGDTHILFKCWAQDCALDALLEAVGLTHADISPPIAAAPPATYAAVHDYHDAAGVLRYQVLRVQTPTGAKKKFLQRRPGGNGAGAWIWDLKGTTRLPYRLHELAGHARVFVCEGEKDVDRLWALGLPATCNSGGAGHWTATESAALKAIGVQRVVLLQDCDGPGAAHVASATTHLTAAGIKSWTLPPFPDVPATGGDVSDWFDLGHTVVELEALIQQQMSAATPVVLAKITGLDVMLTEPEDLTRWIVEDRIPAGSVCLLVAKPKVGKTTAARHLAVAIARGESWLGSSCEQGLVWYMAFEGRKADHLSHFRQFQLTQDDAARIWCYIDAPTPTILSDMRQRALTDKPTLIIVDTLQRLLQVKSMDDYAEVTKAFDALIALVREVGCALLLLHHAGKAMDRDPLDSVLGSTAIAGSVDNTMVLSKLSGFRTVTTRQRVGPDLDERVIQLTDTGRVVLGGSRELAEMHALKQKLMTALMNAAGRLTTLEWSELVEGRKQAKLLAMRQLVIDGEVTCTGKGKRDNPFIYSVPAVPAVPAVPEHGNRISEPQDDNFVV